MSKPVYVNGEEIFAKYKAKLLSYSIGTVSISDSYMTRKNSISPVKFKEAIGTRKITLKLEFEGDTCHEALVNISNLTVELLFLPDTVSLNRFQFPIRQKQERETVFFRKSAV